MRWQIGGNFEPVRMVCKIDWKQCPAAIANYVWTEIVTDVVECITNDSWLVWRLVVAIIIISLIARILCRKMRCVDEVALNKEALHRVSCKMQDLELKINILTYKIQYGAWPLPHQIRGPNAKKQLRNIRLTLSNVDDRNVWIKRMLLSPSSNSCISGANIDNPSKRHLNDLFNVRSRCNLKYDRSESTHSESKCSRSSSERSFRRWKRNARNSEIIKFREQRQSKSEKFLLRYRNTEALRDGSNNTVPQTCNKYLESMEDCKRFLQELKRGNKSLGLIQDSSETNDESLTNVYSKKNPYPAQRMTSKGSGVIDSDDTEKVVNVVKPVRQRSKRPGPNQRSDENNLNASNVIAPSSKFTRASMKSTPSITVAEAKEMNNILLPSIPHQTRAVQSSQHTLHLVRRKLQSLHNMLQKFNSTGCMRTFEEKEKASAKALYKNFVKALSANRIGEERKSRITFGVSPKESSRVSTHDSKKSQIFHHSPEPSKVLFHHNPASSTEQFVENPRQSSLIFGVSPEESEVEDCRSECNSFLSVQSYSDAVVYNDEVYHRTARLLRTDSATEAKRAVSLAGTSVNHLLKDLRQQIDAINNACLAHSPPQYSNVAHTKSVPERTRYFSYADLSKNEVKYENDKADGKGDKLVLLEEASNPSVDSDDPLFVSPRSSTSEASKLSEFKEKSTVALLREALEVKKSLVRELESQRACCETMYLAETELQNQFESKLLDVIKEESPSTSTAKTSRTFVFVETDPENERTVEEKDLSVKSCTSSVIAKNRSARLNSERVSDSNDFVRSDRSDSPGRNLENVSSRIDLNETKFASSSCIAEIEGDQESVEAWKRFCQQSDKIEKRAEGDVLRARGTTARKSTAESDGSDTDCETRNELLTAKSVARDESGKTDEQEKQQASTVKDIGELVRRSVNDVRNFTELFSKSQNEAIMQIQKVMQYQSEHKITATGIVEEHSKTAVCNDEEQSCYNENDFCLENGSVENGNRNLFLKRDPEAFSIMTKISPSENFSTSEHESEILSPYQRKVDAEKSMTLLQEIQPDRKFSICAIETNDSKSRADLASEQSSAYFMDDASIHGGSLSKCSIFNDDGPNSRLRKIDSARLGHQAQRRSVESINFRHDEADTETADFKDTSGSETIENADDKDSISVPTTNFSSDTSTSYVDASASSLFDQSKTQASQKDIHISNALGTYCEQKARTISKKDLPSPKSSKPINSTDRSPLMELGTPRSCVSAQSVKNAENTVRTKGKSNICLAEAKAEESARESLERFEKSSSHLRRTRSRSQIACRSESPSKSQPDGLTKGIQRRNNSSDSITSGKRSGVLIPETKVSRSCIPVLKTRLMKEGRSKSPARSPLTMTMLWTVNPSFRYRNSPERTVQAEGCMEKQKSETNLEKDTEAIKDSTNIIQSTNLAKDKQFLLAPETKSMLYMQVFTNHEHSLIRIVDPKTFLGYLRDRELEIQNVVHQDQSESLICRKNSFLTVIEQATNVRPQVLTIVPSGVSGGDNLDGSGPDRVCSVRSGTLTNFKPVSVQQREIYVTAKPSVIHTSTSISGLKCVQSVDNVHKTMKKGQNQTSVQSIVQLRRE